MLVLLTAAWLALDGLGSSPAAAQSAPNSPGQWSGNLIQNGSFSGGNDDWDTSPFFFTLGADELPVTNVDGNPALELLIFERGQSFASDCTAVGARQIVEIDDQTLRHDFRLRWRLRAEQFDPGTAGVALAVGPADAANSLFTTFNFSSNRWEAFEMQPASEGVWQSGELEFTVRATDIVDALRIDIMPMFNTSAGGICDSGARAFLDDVELSSWVVDAPLSDVSLPRFEDLSNQGEAGATAIINAYRAISGATPVTHSFSGSAGARAHATYMTLTGISSHFELPNLPGYSEAGDEAARTSSLCSGQTTLAGCVESLLTVPYHRFGQLLDQTGFGQYELQLGFESGNGVVGYLDDILGQLDAFFAARSAAQSAPPLIWPADGLGGIPASIELHESPDPLFLCDGAPANRVTGYPITVEVPFATEADTITNGTGSLRLEGSAAVALCSIDAQTPHPQHAAILAAGSRPAIFPGKMIFLPLQPLLPGSRYRFTFRGNVRGEFGSWSTTFTTAGVPALTFASSPAPLELVPLTRTPGVVSLHRGWNLVGSGVGGPIATVTDPLGGIFLSVFAWDAAEATFRSFNPQFPFLTTLQDVTAGAGLWMFVDDPEGTLWLQPPIQDAREVSLETGFNLVMWTGPETDVAQAVASIGDALRAMFVWDPLGQAFLSFNPSLPSQLNTASTLRYGDGVWVQTSAPATWSQPAP